MTKYTFLGDGSIFFDEEKNVAELIAYAFDEFGYYEPIGIDRVTVFQCHYPESSEGWFTTDTTRTCKEEIKNADELCFAYYVPGVFYYAEGGWGHHMEKLGNHPFIKDAVSLHLRFDNFDHTVVVAGRYRVMDMIRYMQKYEYLTDNLLGIVIRVINPYKIPVTILMDDPVLKMSLTDFEKWLPDSVIIVEIHQGV